MNQAVEIELAGGRIAEPYLAEVSVAFRRAGGELRRPAFWDGDATWRVRFAAPESGTWTWATEGLPGGERSGSVEADVQPLLRLPQGRRNASWTDGRPFFPVTDTAWALPFRATLDETAEYADDRASKGFSAALLMTVQPDTRAEGPDDRTALDGFARGFDDLSAGTLQRLRPEYFRHLDRQVEILLRAGIVPIHTPLFYGFGWKGLDVIGPRCPVEDGRRFVRYLCARYGAWPAMWLVGADGTGWEPAVRAMGDELGRIDPDGQPVGIHYNPWQSSDAHWLVPWCKFHLLQTGHDGDHRPDRVAHLSSMQPTRAVANGEPTYEGMGGGLHGLGEWQSIEAWENLMAGGTFGCFYGAGSLWQWKRQGETAWGDWSAADYDWRAAMHQVGSSRPGVIGRALDSMDFAEMQPELEFARAKRCVAVPGRFALVYLPEGGGLNLAGWAEPLPWVALDARTGRPLAEGLLPARSDNPWMGCWVDLPRRPIAVRVGHPVYRAP